MIDGYEFNRYKPRWKIDGKSSNVISFNVIGFNVAEAVMCAREAWPNFNLVLVSAEKRTVKDTATGEVYEFSLDLDLGEVWQFVAAGTNCKTVAKDGDFVCLYDEYDFNELQNAIRALFRDPFISLVETTRAGIGYALRVIGAGGVQMGYVRQDTKSFVKQSPFVNLAAKNSVESNETENLADKAEDGLSDETLDSLRKVSALAGVFWEHKKRGTKYRVLFGSVLQVSDSKNDMAVCVNYQDLMNGAVFTRPLVDFADGRFAPFRRYVFQEMEGGRLIGEPVEFDVHNIESCKLLYDMHNIFADSHVLKRCDVLDPEGDGIWGAYVGGDKVGRIVELKAGV